MKRFRLTWLILLLSVLQFGPITATGQEATAAPPSGVVPRLVNFSGKAADQQGRPIAGIAAATFAIYKDQYDGAPLWLETQNVRVDASGNFTAQLGVTKAEGLPLDLFSSGEARWLGVRVNGGEEQPRVLLISVPYALKAADAQTLGGLPASAFVLAMPSANSAPGEAAASTASSAPPPASSDVTTTGGTLNTLPLFTTPTSVQSSIITQTGSGTAGRIGINTNLPGSTLDVNGTATVRGILTSPATGTANSAKGFTSQPQDFIASVFNSSVAGPVPQKFQWQAEPINNNLSTASGTLNLLYASGSATPAETGLKINSKGLLTFAGGQTFPIAAGSVTDAMLQNSSLTVKAGTDLTGGGTVSLGGSTTLNLDTTKVPQLAAQNKFTNQNTINVNTVCNQALNCFPGLTVNNTGGSASASGGDGIDINSGAFSVGLRVNSGSEGMFVTSQFTGALFEGNGGGGIYGDEQVDADFLAGVNGFQIAGPATHKTIGVWGSTTSQNGFGVYGNQVLSNQSGLQRPAGVWGDSSVSAGIFASSDNDDAIAAVSADKNLGQTAGFFDNLSSNPSEAVIKAEGFNLNGMCIIYTNGDLACSGSKSAVVPVAQGSRQVALYAIEGPENWFEDAGAGKLTNGAGVVNLESVFGETVNTNLDYRVFLTPNGDCKGLYVAKKSPDSFVVRELGGGTSNISFDYRIMAKRKGYENIRLADRTAIFRMSETPTGMKKRPGFQVKTPPSPQQIREERMKLAGVRSTAQVRNPERDSAAKK